MRKPCQFRPVTERLEPRTVLSAFTGAPALDAQKVEMEFETFEQQYLTDVRTILVPLPTSIPAANRPAFDQAVGTQLIALNTAIDADIANLPTATTLAANIKFQLLGIGLYSLRPMLNGVATPANTTFFAVVQFEQRALWLINTVEFNVTTQVREAPPPSGTLISGQTLQQDLTSIQAAFMAFNTAYANATTTVLDPPGTINLAANRPAFNNAIMQNLGVLFLNIESAVSNLPSPVTTSLMQSIPILLLTTPGNPSLQSSLLSIPTATSTSGLPTMRFLATVQINMVRGQVDQLVSNAVNQYNSTGQ